MNRNDTEIKSILQDKVHGSTELLNLIYKNFLKHHTNIEQIKKDLIRIQKQFSHFPVIINFIKDIENIVNGKKRISLDDYLKSFGENDKLVYQRIFNSGKSKLLNSKKVLTISHSKTLLKIFAIWKKLSPNLKVLICESRPENEGILMAKELSKLGINFGIITEAMAGTAIKEVDVVILGADQILTNGNIVNKTGSRLLAVLAKHHHLPVYVLASSVKRLKKKRIPAEKIKIKKNNKSRNKLIKFRFDIFEEVEKKLITKIFTD